jgi:hypothetical protein
VLMLVHMYLFLVYIKTYQPDDQTLLEWIYYLIVRWHQACTWLAMVTLTFNVYSCFHAYLEDNMLGFLVAAAILCSHVIPNEDTLRENLRTPSVEHQDQVQRVMTKLRDCASRV